jgi:hypothetical protein
VDISIRSTPSTHPLAGCGRGKGEGGLMPLPSDRVGVEWTTSLYSHSIHSSTSLGGTGTNSNSRPSQTQSQ